MDIDIDVKSDFDLNGLFPTAVRGSMVNGDKISPHNCGVYFQNIPVDHITGLAAIPYKEAENIGYLKIDFIHLTLLNEFSSKQEMDELLEMEPDWDMLLDRNIVETLFQVSKHYFLLKKIKPRSVQELSDVLALIRPAKSHLVNEYLEDRKTTREKLYIKEHDDKFLFKKSHAVAYALTIVLQLNKIKREKENVNG